MSSFTLQLASATQQRRLEGVSSFIARDASGRFGLMAGHAPMSTVLSYGLARLRLTNSTPSPLSPPNTDDGWLYLALPGGVLRFADNMLSIATRTYVVGTEVDAVSQTLERELQRDVAQQKELRRTLLQLEQTLMKSLWQLEQQ